MSPAPFQSEFISSVKIHHAKGDLVQVLCDMTDRRERNGRKRDERR